MDYLFMNRRIVVDNIPIIVAVLRGEIAGYYDRPNQAVQLFTAESVVNHPETIDGMTGLTFNQIAAEQGWTAEEIQAAKELIK